MRQRSMRVSTSRCWSDSDSRATPFGDIPVGLLTSQGIYLLGSGSAVCEADCPSSCGLRWRPVGLRPSPASIRRVEAEVFCYYVVVYFQTRDELVDEKPRDYVI